jgi:uncharacterized DUF497 family protein
MKVAGFVWDDGNWPKCGNPAVMSDPHPDEPRMRAIGRTKAGRFVFLVFMLRQDDVKTLLRPISARFMHQKEIDHYENQV